MNAIHSISLLALVAFVSGCRPSTDSTSSDVVARVGSRELRLADLEQEAARRAKHGAEVVSPEQLLEDLVQREAQLAQVSALGLDRDPEVRRALENVLLSNLRRRELEPRLETTEVSASEVVAHYEAHQSRFTQPAQRHFALLQATIPSKASPDSRSRLRGRLAEARERAVRESATESGFGALAVEYSDDAGSRYQGGDIGWVTAEPDRYRWDSQVLAAGFALAQPGDLSGILEVSNRLYIVKCLGSREATTTPLTQVEATIRHQLQQTKRKQIEADFAADARRSVQVTIYPEILSAMGQQLAAAQSKDEPPPPLRP